MAINIQAVTVGPKKVVSIKFISRGTPNAAPEIRFCNPVPMFWRLVILAFKSTVLLLYTANWNRQKYTQPATNTAQPMQLSTASLPVAIAGIIRNRVMSMAMLYRIYLARSSV